MRYIPFELIGEIASAGGRTKARDVEGGRGARHGGVRVVVDLRGVLSSGPVNIEQMRWDRNKVDKLVSNDDGEIDVAGPLQLVPEGACHLLFLGTETAAEGRTYSAMLAVHLEILLFLLLSPSVKSYRPIV